jgi:hypothetical protein
MTCSGMDFRLTRSRYLVQVNSCPGRHDANLRFRGFTSTDLQCSINPLRYRSVVNFAPRSGAKKNRETTGNTPIIGRHTLGTYGDWSDNPEKPEITMLLKRWLCSKISATR